jgi:hypothetical protein
MDDDHGSPSAATLAAAQANERPKCGTVPRCASLSPRAFVDARSKVPAFPAGAHGVLSQPPKETSMTRTLALSAAALVQSTIVLAAPSACFAQEEATKALFVPIGPAAPTDAMTAGLGPLTLFIASEVAFMTLLAFVIALLMRRPVREVRSGAMKNAA